MYVIFHIFLVDSYIVEYKSQYLELFYHVNSNQFSHRDLYPHVNPKTSLQFNMIYFCIQLKFSCYITLLDTAEIVENEEISDGLEQTTFVTFFLFNHDCSQTVISHIRQLYKIK